MNKVSDMNVKNITLEDLTKHGIVTDDLVELTLFEGVEYDEGKVLEPFGRAQGYKMPDRLFISDKEGLKTAGYISMPVQSDVKIGQKVYLIGVNKSPPISLFKGHYMFSWYVELEAVKSFRKL